MVYIHLYIHLLYHLKFIMSTQTALLFFNYCAIIKKIYAGYEKSMNSEERRSLIIERLQQSKEPISASSLAKDFAVTRQIIVADIALLRAAGYSIIADNKGYLLNTIDNANIKRIVVKHDKNQVLDEFYAVIDNGGKFLDVIVEHSIYGRISVELNISSRYDAEEFVKKIDSTKANPLFLLTEGVHIHTITIPDENAFARIKEQLTGLGILIETT